MTLRKHTPSLQLQIILAFYGSSSYAPRISGARDNHAVDEEDIELPDLETVKAEYRRRQGRDM